MEGLEFCTALCLHHNGSKAFYTFALLNLTEPMPALEPGLIVSFTPTPLPDTAGGRRKLGVLGDKNDPKT
jgi:hypothetical protein